MGNVTPHDILSMDDPLTQENAEILCDYKEEDEYVDYKSQFKSGSEKDWLEITKDIMAFANTYGGFLVYGVEDQSKKLSELLMKRPIKSLIQIIFNKK